MDKQNFLMSEKIKRKLFEWKQEISRLKDLKYYHRKVLTKIQIQMRLMEHLNLELHNLCSVNEKRRWRSTTKSECTTEQGADNIQKLHFLMLHQTKKLSEENKLLRAMKLRQQREVSATEEMKNSTEAESKSTNSTTIKGKALNPKISNKSIRNQIKGVCDALMAMEIEKKDLEAKIKKAEKISGEIKKEIRSWVRQLKDKQDRNEAYFCILDQRSIYKEECWVLQYRNLESDHSCMIYMDKSSSRWIGSCRNLTTSYNINCL
ncbi:hypothetical protein K1719_016793 [Acacia pycnantha]|nr:hypothetical protein K1719_016793 [Acacia pycnantha]